MVSHKIAEGLSTIFNREVRSSDTETSYGSGTLSSLLSTPAAMTMLIDASAKMLDPLLPPGFITVGKRIELSHEKPTLAGEKISFVITVTKVQGDEIHLDFSIHDTYGLICKGKYERQVVNSAKLMEIAYSRVGSSLHGR